MQSAQNYGAVPTNEMTADMLSQTPEPKSGSRFKAVLGVVGFVIAMATVALLVSSNQGSVVASSTNKAAKAMNLKKTWTPVDGENTPPPSPSVIEYTRAPTPDYTFQVRSTTKTASPPSKPPL